jgi:hypothetical protein
MNRNVNTVALINPDCPEEAAPFSLCSSCFDPSLDRLVCEGKAGDACEGCGEKNEACNACGVEDFEAYLHDGQCSDCAADDRAEMETRRSLQGWI